MSKPVSNASYRKLRGTDKPFSNSEEQVQAIWAEQVRRPGPRVNSGRVHPWPVA